MSVNCYFDDAVACDKHLRLFSDSSSSISLTACGIGELSGYRSFFQPMVVPPSSSDVNLPYLPNQLLMKSGYFSLRSCFFRFVSPAIESNPSQYVRCLVYLYVGTKSVVDYYLFRSYSYVHKGLSAEVVVPDIERLFVPSGKNVFFALVFSGPSGTSYRYSVDFRYCMTFDD